MEKELFFNRQATALQGRLETNSNEKAAIITHPHPLYGGDMDNIVVTALTEAYAEMQYTTLRFNFRGAGLSKGQYDDGLGEQEDVQAAVDHLKSEGFEQIELAGYSFGAWVLANWSRNQHPHPHVLRFVAPPVAFVDFDDRRPIPGVKHIFVGSRDDLAPSARIEAALPHWQPDARVHVIPNSDHFFGNRLAELKAEFMATI